jgi:acetoin utilization deacetylase AcuC-like enzyme
MKVLVPKTSPMKNLQDYGIDIPLLASRPDSVVNDLRIAYESSRKDNFAVSSSYLLSWDPELLIGAKDLLRVHQPEYVENLLRENPLAAVASAYELISENGDYHRYFPDRALLPLTHLVERTLLEASGTLHACQQALDDGSRYFLGGGMHHAMTHGGRGFCLINDIAIAIRRLQSDASIKTAWIIDVDAHKGDGTAEIFFRDPDVLTLSIHMAEGWPLDESPWQTPGVIKPQFIPSTIDIGIHKNHEADYLPALENGLRQMERVGRFTRPDIAIIVDGSDPYEGDTLPSANLLQLSAHQCLERDLLIHSFLTDRSIPQVWLLAGGYGPEVWKIHAQFLRKILI